MEAGVVRSPVKLKLEDVPEVTLSDFLLQRVASHLPHLADTPWVVDFLSGSHVLYGEVELHSRHVAAAIAHYTGFKRGEVLFSSVYECSHLYVVMLAAWRLGGVTRSCYQLEDPAEVARQMRETRTCLVLMDRDTAPLLLEAAKSLERPVTFLSVGRDPVPNTIHYTQLLNFDASEFPKMSLQDINVRDDAVIITSTSGSTGRPKGAMHSHFAIICTLFARRVLRTGTRHMTQSNIDNIANWFPVIAALTTGATIYVIPMRNRQRQNYIDTLLNIKPEYLYPFYPGLAGWFARDPRVAKLDLSFIKSLQVGGAVMDYQTLKLLEKLMSADAVNQYYGMSECTGITHTGVGVSGTNTSLKIIQNEEEICITSGRLQAFVEAKIVDLETGKTLEKRGTRGEIWIRTPRITLGYITADGKPDRSKIDADGWFHTGDIGFFDEEDYLYVRGRINCCYRMLGGIDIEPSEIEDVLKSHEAVLTAGVVGVPNLDVLNVTRAYVVLLDHVTVTADELKNFVAARLPVSKHITGGICFVPDLPVNRNNKLDRLKLQKISCVPL